MLAITFEDGFSEERVGRVEGWAGSDAVVAVDSEQGSVERAVVERVQNENVLWVLSQIGVLTSWKDVG